jgi:hypothetical protein
MSGPGGSPNAPSNLPLPATIPLGSNGPLRPLPLHENLASPGQMPPDVVPVPSEARNGQCLLASRARQEVPNRRNMPNRASVVPQRLNFSPANGLAGNLSSIAFENSENLSAAALSLVEPATIRRNATHQALRAARAAVDNIPENIRRELESYIDRSRYGVPSPLWGPTGPRSRSRSRNRNNRNNRNNRTRNRNRTARK